MSNTLFTAVSGSAVATSSIPYILVKRKGISLGRVVLFYIKEPRAERNVPIAQQYIRAIADRCELAPIELVPVGIEESKAPSQLAALVKAHFERERAEGNRVYVDSTCGRKHFSNTIVRVSLEFKETLEDILYCYLRDTRLKNTLCPRIPRPYYQVFSILRPEEEL